MISEAAYNARRMKIGGAIADTWVNHGRVMVKDHGNRKHRIRHKSDLLKFGPLPLNNNQHVPDLRATHETRPATGPTTIQARMQQYAYQPQHSQSHSPYFSTPANNGPRYDGPGNVRPIPYSYR